MHKKLLPPKENSIEFHIENNIPENTEEVLDCRIEEKRKSELLELKMRQESAMHDTLIESTSLSNSVRMEPESVNDNQEILCLAMKKIDDCERPTLSIDNDNNTDKLQKKRRKKKEGKLKKDGTPRTKYLKHDIRKAPMDAKLSNHDEIEDQELLAMTPMTLMNDNIMDSEKFETDSMSDENIDEKSEDDSNCRACNTKHNKNECQIYEPLSFITDTVKYSDWLEVNKQYIEEEKVSFDSNLQIKAEDLEDEDDNDNDIDNEDEIENESIDTSSNMSTSEFAQNFTIKKNPQPPTEEIHNNIPSFSEVSLPPQFSLSLNDGLGIFTKIFLPKYTQLGPVLGQKIVETDITDDCSMKYIFESFEDGKSNFLSVENKNRSNWLRYIRPAMNRDMRNTTLVVKDSLIFFVTCSDIEAGCELFYWSDENNSAWDKKKIDRTSQYFV